MTFWFFPFPRLIFMLAPLSYILFNVKIFVSNVDEAVAYTLTYMIVNVMVQNYLFGSVRWPWVSELYNCPGRVSGKCDCFGRDKSAQADF